VGLDGQMKVVPALAESWSNPDENTWVLKLRRGVRFHTGGVMTADDVLFSFDRARRRAHTALVSLESLEAVPDGVRFRTRAPDASLLGKLRDVFVVSRTFVTGKGEAALATTSAGTGPFSFTAADASKDVVLHAFDHWGGRPAFSRVRFATRLLDTPAVPARAPGLPHFFSLRPSSPASATAAASFDRVVVPGLSVAYLGFDLRGAETPGVAVSGSQRENPFLVFQVRQAIAKSLDLAAVRASAGAGFIPSQMIPPMVFGHAPDVPAPRQDLAEAKRLLAGTRFAKGFRVRFDYREIMKDLAEPIAANLDALGITVDRNPLPDQAFFDVVESGQSSLYLLRFSCRYGDAQEFFDRWAHSRDIAAGLGVANYSYEKSLVPGLDEAIDGSRREIRPEIRMSKLQAISDARLETSCVPISTKTSCSPPRV
jgi:peptide/nickel transport system substrate-binding protein